MKKLKAILENINIKKGFYLLILPLVVFFFEILIKVLGKLGNFDYHLFGLLLHSLGIGLIFSVIASLFNSEKTKQILLAVIIEVFTVFFTSMYFVENSFATFMDIKAIFQETGDVFTGFTSTILSIFYSSYGTILLFQVPFILFLIFRKCFDYSKILNKKIVQSSILFGVAILLITFSFVFQSIKAEDKLRLTSEYEFDNVVRIYGLLPGFGVDLKYILFEYDREVFIDFENVSISKPSDEKTLERNELNIDFTSLYSRTSYEKLKNMYLYLNSLDGSNKNEYTGIFEGKNLIFITAESFTKAVVSEELTPTLYRLMTKGINFNNYYQPAWGGSTTTGEFSLLTGLIPTSRVGSMQETIGKNMWTTIGNMLKSEGYFSAGYHNNDYTYYDRQNTHKNLGYATWTGMGNGMEQGVRWIWPESDDEMMRFTIDKFINKEPFSIYYITVSGHTNYTTTGNNMVRENWSRVKNLDCSDAIKGYIACNLELEDAMTYLISRLEEAGIADDTVIVLTGDHYPYGLENSAVWQTNENYLLELYGVDELTDRVRDQNGLIIWCGSLENDEPIIVDEPTYSLDILPTLCNLFGVSYDSRLVVGRDVFSSTEPLVVWYNRSFYTNKGYYDAAKNIFYPNDGVELENEEEYISTIKKDINNKFALSETILSTDIYNQVYKNYKLSSTVEEDTIIKNEVM